MAEKAPTSLNSDPLDKVFITELPEFVENPQPERLRERHEQDLNVFRPNDEWPPYLDHSGKVHQ